MNSSMHRIIVTEKGRELRKGILNPPFESPTFSATRQSITPQNSMTLSPSTPYVCRTGYFRPKISTHSVLKTSASNRIYPNYLKRDPHEYPLKHQCIWNPIPTVKGHKAAIPSAFPTTKTIHHVMFRSENEIGTDSLSIKDFNAALGGQNNHLTINLTACQYPDYNKIEASSQSPKQGGDSILGDSMSIAGTSKGWTSGKRSSSDEMIPLNGRSKSEKAGFKLPLNKLGNSSLLNGETTTQRQGSVSQAGNSDELLSSYACRTHRDLNKITEEKAMLAFKRHNQKQKDYLSLLDRLDKKMKDRLLIKLENPDYMTGLENKLKQSREWLESEIFKGRSETARYKQRVKSLGESKYGKIWKKEEDFSKKSLKGSLMVVDMSKMTNEIRKDSVVLSQARGTRTAGSSEISQAFRQSIELNLET